MAVPAQLFRLEQVDAELDRLEAELGAAQRKQRRNPTLETLERRLETARAEEQRLGSEQRGLEADLADLESSLDRDQRRLYGGQIVDPRELASLEKELAHHRTQRESVEERLLEVMERFESAQADAASLSRQVNEARERWEVDRQALALEAEGAADALAGMRAEREAVAAAVEPAALRLYDRLRAGQGHAVSTVDHGVCQWCRVNLPAKDIQHARSGSLATCTNCGRILYVNGSP